ncbi:MAG: hypothetical protein J6T24_05200, partial [Clostridia bacterium]|nr:hypothetical protein [Clostridia bacterium]
DGTAWVSGSDETPYIGYPKSDGYYSLKSVQNNPSGAKHSANSPAGRNTFYMFNAVEAMDIPGEWYLDRETGYLYVYPDGDLSETTMSVSNDASCTIISASGTEHVVFDGIHIDGATNYGYYLDSVNSVVVQNVKVTNTRASCVQVRGTSRNVAIIYSDFSRASSSLVSLSLNHTTETLTPSGVVVQNCIFHDTLPTYQVGVSFSGCRTVISHNYFKNTTTSGGNCAEVIIEYNRYEGGSADVTDGGMCYTWGYTSRRNHYRYNLFHMFNATHNAIYNDGTSSSNYAYGNMISFLGSASNRNKGWYSSSGTGNVCYGNVMVLRNPYQVAGAGSNGGYEADIVPANAGDSVNESNLFYYYFGDEYSAGGAAAKYTPRDYNGTAQLKNNGTLSQSLAGHWWVDMMNTEQGLYYGSYDTAAWQEWEPQHMNYLLGTQLILAALNESDYHPKYFYVPWYLSGKTFTYDKLPAGTLLQIPEYSYLDASGQKKTVEMHTEIVGEDGTVTLTYEEIAAMERFRRQPACCVISNNILLGGTPTYEGGRFTDISDPSMIVTDSCLGSEGYVATSLVEKNLFEYEYDEILLDAENYVYDLLSEAYDRAEETMDPEGYKIIEESLWYECGLSYDYDYTQWWD